MDRCDATLHVDRCDATLHVDRCDAALHVDRCGAARRALVNRGDEGRGRRGLSGPARRGAGAREIISLCGHGARTYVEHADPSPSRRAHRGDRHGRCARVLAALRTAGRGGPSARRVDRAGAERSERVATRCRPARRGRRPAARYSPVGAGAWTDPRNGSRRAGARGRYDRRGRAPGRRDHHGGTGRHGRGERGRRRGSQWPRHRQCHRDLGGRRNGRPACPAGNHRQPGESTRGGGAGDSTGSTGSGDACSRDRARRDSRAPGPGHQWHGDLDAGWIAALNRDGGTGYGGGAAARAQRVLRAR